MTDQFALDAQIRELDTKIIEEQSKALKDQNEFLLTNLEAARQALAGSTGRDLLDRQARNRQTEEAQRLAEEAADAYEREFRDTFSGVQDLLQDVFTGNIDAAEDWGPRIGNFVDKLLDETFDALAKNFAQSAIGGGGGSGGGIFGAISQFFTGGGTGGTAPPTPAFPAGGGDFFTPSSGGGLGGLGSLAGFGIGALAGSFFGGAFDSDSGTSIQSTLDPLPDVPGSGATVNITNNGVPMQVDSTTRRSNGDLDLVVSSAVAKTTQSYDRSMRRGYGPFAESLGNNTSADRTV